MRAGAQTLNLLLAGGELIEVLSGVGFRASVATEQVDSCVVIAVDDAVSVTILQDEEYIRKCDDEDRYYLYLQYRMWLAENSFANSPRLPERISSSSC